MARRALFSTTKSIPRDGRTIASVTKHNQPPACKRQLRQHPKASPNSALSGTNGIYSSDAESLPARGTSTSSEPHLPIPSTSFSSADPILATINPRNFPKQFAQLSKHDNHKHRMNVLLENIWTGRIENQTRLLQEAQCNQERRQARVIARLEAAENGLPPPGADPQMLHFVNSKGRPRHAKRRPIRKIRSTIPNSSIVDGCHPWKQIFRGEEHSKPPLADSDATSEESGATKSKTVFEMLLQVLVDKSANYLSPHLATSISSPDYGEGDYHPRWQYTRWRSSAWRGRRR